MRSWTATSDLALAATIAFLGMNGFRFTHSNNAAYDLVIAVVEGRMDDIGALAEIIGAAIERR